MAIRTSLLACAAALCLAPTLALAHPAEKSAEAQNGKLKNKTVKIIELDGNSPFSGRIKIEDFDFDFSELSKSFAEGLEALEGIEGLDKLKDFTGIDVSTLKGEGGETIITIKKGKGGMFAEMFSDMELQFNKGATQKHHKHKEKHADASEDHSRLIIKNLLKKSKRGKTPFSMTSDHHEDGSIVVHVDENGTVKIMRGGADVLSSSSESQTVNVDTNVSIKNGRRTTRIIIDIEESAQD